MLLPTTTNPPCPSSETPWATNRRPSMPKAPESDRWVHVEPSVVAHTVVVETVALDPVAVELVVPTMRRSLSKVVKYGPKSILTSGGFVALPQLTPCTAPVGLAPTGWLGRVMSSAETTATVAVRPAKPNRARRLGGPGRCRRRVQRSPARGVPREGTARPLRPSERPRPRPRS